MLGFTLLKLKGDSMSPKVSDGSYILASRWFLMFFLGEGKRVLIQHSTYGLIVKTVALVDHHGFIWLKAENNQSLSIEQIGPIDKTQVIGRVLNIFNRRD
jgi:phage repressor protein C with HTH and peptisase S24 domain